MESKMVAYTGAWRLAPAVYESPPDLYYNGGILRTLQVAEMARQYGARVGIAPHTPKADPLIAPFWQVAACCPISMVYKNLFIHLAKKRLLGILKSS
ncbi:MAG: hypothetical protein R2822_22680 [Spirosomataceae bacterium]